MNNWEEKTKKYDKITRDRVICPTCGHSLLFGRFDKIICSWCRHYVFKDSKTEFEYRLKESINRKK